MRTWRRCRRKWWLSYYRGYRPTGIDFNRPLSIGTRVHDALAAYYEPDVAKREDPLEFIQKSVATDISNNPDHEADIEAEGELCTIMMEGYLQWLEETGADSDLMCIEPESEMEIELFPGVTLLSKIDARMERKTDGARLALETKTVASLDQNLETLQLDTQLLTEHLVEFLKLKEEGEETHRAQGVIYNMLRKVKRSARAKPPFYGREEVRHNENELRNHWKHVVAHARDILEAHEKLDRGDEHHYVVYPNPGRDCRWDCEFRKICPMFDDGSDVEAALNDLYETGDPLARYESSGPNAA